MKKFALLGLLLTLTFGCATVPPTAKSGVEKHCDEAMSFGQASSEFVQAELIKNEDKDILVEYDLAACELTEDPNKGFSIVVYKVKLNDKYLREMAMVVFLVRSPTKGWEVVNSEILYINDYNATAEPEHNERQYKL